MEKTFMSKIALLTTAGLMAAGMATAQNRGVLIEDNFDSYTVGQKLAQQAQAAGLSYWSTWSNAPGGVEDAVISNAQSQSPSNSANLLYGNDLILNLGDVTSGQYEVAFNIYVPNDKVGYFNLLHHFDGSANAIWALEVYFNYRYENGTMYYGATGEGVVNAGGTAATQFTFTPDLWVPVRVNIDIDADQAQLRVSDQLIHTWQWSLQATGEAYGGKLSVLDIFPPVEGYSDFFIDDVVFSSTADMCLPPTNFAASLNTAAASVNLSWSGIAAAYNIYRNDELIAENVTGGSYYDEQPGEGEFCYYATSVCGELESEPSNTSCATVVVCHAPQGLTATVEGDNVVLNWESTGATVYKVLRDGQVIGVAPNATTYTQTGYDGGNYCYTVRGVCGGMDSPNSNEACVSATGIDDAANARVSVYPNPGRDMVTVATGGEFARVEVINILGQAVIDMPVCEATFDLDIAQLNKGLYIVRLSKDNVAKHIKFVKE